MAETPDCFGLGGRVLGFGACEGNGEGMLLVNHLLVRVGANRATGNARHGGLAHMGAAK